jgi:hypothetical protein
MMAVVLGELVATSLALTARADDACSCDANRAADHDWCARHRIGFVCGVRMPSEPVYRVLLDDRAAEIGHQGSGIG